MQHYNQAELTFKALVLSIDYVDILNLNKWKTKHFNTKFPHAGNKEKPKKLGNNRRDNYRPLCLQLAE